MIIKTTAVVLRFYPYSNTSRVVSWMTPDLGRIATLVKGSQRPRSLFLGQYDLFYTCELLFYQRDGGGIHIARECSPLKMRTRFRSDWKAAATASYLAGLVSKASPPEAPHAGLFDLLDDALDFLDAFGTAAPFLFWFELQLLERMGLAPRLRRCAACGRDLPLSERQADFAVARGGLVCPACALERGEKDRVGPDLLALLGGWQQARSPQGPLRTRVTARQLVAVEALLGEFLAYHLEVQPTGRRAALEVLARRIAER